MLEMRFDTRREAAFGICDSGNRPPSKTTGLGFSHVDSGLDASNLRVAIVTVCGR